MKDKVQAGWSPYHYAYNDPVNGSDGSSSLLGWVQLGLDVVGLIPVVGEVADGLNAAIYFANGDYLNAGLSAAAMIPIAGWGATGTKVGIKAVDAAQSLVKLTVKEQAEQLGKQIGRNTVIIETVNKKIRYDIVGKAHGSVPTPHMQVYRKNIHEGQVRSITRASKLPDGMAQQEVRIVRNYLQRK